MRPRFRRGLIEGTVLGHSRGLRREATGAEHNLWFNLRRKSLFGLKFRRQYPIGGFIVDFCCLERRLVIELDGGQHAEQVAYDERRTRFLASKGFRVLRFWNNEVLTNMEGVLQAIVQAAEVAPAPSPSRR